MKPAIMEAGYPTKNRGAYNKAEQVEYISTVFNATMQRAQNNYIAFLSLHMLWDENPNAYKEWIIDRYCGWGVLREVSKKPGWYTLRDWFMNKLGG